MYGLYPENCPTQPVVVVKVEEQSPVLESPIARVVSQMKGTKVESSFKQLTARH